MHARTRVVASALLLAAVGCQDDVQSPSQPRAAPEAGVAAATALAFWQVDPGRWHTCGVTTDHRAYCWGDNAFGALGDGNTFTEQLVPVAVTGGLAFKQVSGGGSYTCGITTANRAYCWGYNYHGELGDGTTTPRSRPTAVTGGLYFKQVSAGDWHTCGITTTNRAFCWGDNGFGQLGDGTTTRKLAPVAVAGAVYFKQVSVGGQFTCGVTIENRAYCWGHNGWGELGDSTDVSNRSRPSRVAGARGYRQVAAGGLHACAVTPGDRAFCWGKGKQGQLGTGKLYSLSYWPRRVAGGLSFRRVTAGSQHSCGETTTDQAYCWGANDRGQIGDGTTTQRLVPVPVAGALLFKQVSTDEWHTCGKTPSDVVYCWGYNPFGQLGDGTTATRLTPTQVVDPM